MKRRMFTLLCALALLLTLPWAAMAEDTGTHNDTHTTEYRTNRDGTHTLFCVDCDKAVGQPEKCTFENGVCKVCNWTCDHGGLQANYDHDVTCQICGETLKKLERQEITGKAELTSSGYAYGRNVSDFDVPTPENVNFEVYRPEIDTQDATFGAGKTYTARIGIRCKDGYALADSFEPVLDGHSGTLEGDEIWSFELDPLEQVFSIKYNLDGGTLAGAPESYTAKSADITLPKPTKEGYTFTGWTGTDLTEQTQDVTIRTGSTGDREYTAHWKQIVTVTVTFHTDHGTAPAEQKITSGTKAKEPAAPTEKGWLFKGWYTDEACTKAFDFEKTNVEDDLDLYALWAETYTVTFDVNGHGTAPEAQTVEKDAKAKEPAAPSAKGWRFDGWYTDAKCTKKYSFDTAVTEDITLYAGWTRMYTLTFETNGGTKIDSLEAKEGGLVYLGSYKPTKKGYYFVGWYTDKDLNKSSRVSYVTMDSDKTVYAKWAVADKTNPKTADPAMPGLALAILSLSGTALGALTFKKRK